MYTLRVLDSNCNLRPRALLLLLFSLGFSYRYSTEPLDVLFAYIIRRRIVRFMPGTRVDLCASYRDDRHVISDTLIIRVSTKSSLHSWSVLWWYAIGCNVPSRQPLRNRLDTDTDNNYLIYLRQDNNIR